MAKLKFRAPDFPGFCEKMYEWWNGEDSIYTRQSNAPITKEEFGMFFQLMCKPHGLLFAVTRESGDQKDIVGYFSLERWDNDNGRAWAHVYVDKQWRKRGILKWSVERGLKEFFRGKRMNKIKADIPANNETILSFFQNHLGLEPEAILKKELYIDGKFRDIYSFSILREQYIEMMTKGKEEVKGPEEETKDKGD